MKSNNAIVIAIIAAALIIGGAVFMGYKNKEVVVDSSSNTYLALKDGFMEGCSDGTNYTECSCYFDKIIEREGEKGMMNLSIDYNNTGELPNYIGDIVLECIE